MKRTPRVVIPPPCRNAEKALCAGGNSTHPSAQSTHSEKAVFSAETTPRGVVPTQPQRSEGSDTTPTQKCRKNAKREFLSPPPTGLPPKPSKAVSVGRRRCSGVSEFSSAAATEMSDMQLVPPTASIAFVWSAAKPLPCQMPRAGHGPTPPSCGQKPTPTQSCECFCGNAFTRLRRRSFKGGPVPL